MYISLSCTQGIFSCQSNDFAVGIPVLEALFPSGTPEGTSAAGIDLNSYVYVAGLVQLVFINFMGFFLMETGSTYSQYQPLSAAATEQQQQQQQQQQPTAAGGGGKPGLGPRPSALRIVLRIAVRTLTNKVVFMTLLGMLWNVTIHRLPAYLDQTMTILSAAYTPGALILVGMSMNQEGVSFKGRRLIMPVTLVGFKLLLVPMAMRLYSSLFSMQQNAMDWLFIYGGLPTAPSVYLFATEFAAVPDTIAAGTIIGTILFAPLMVGTTVLVTSPSIDALQQVFHSIALACNVASMVGTFCVLCIPLFYPRWRRYPLDLVVYFAGSWFVYNLLRLAACDSADMASVSGSRIYGITNYFRTCARMWIIVIAANLTLYAARGREAGLRWRRRYHVIAWLGPFVVLTPLAFIVHVTPPPGVITKCVYLYGRSQYIFDAATLVVAIASVIAALSLVEHYHKARGRLPKDLTLMAADEIAAAAATVPLLSGEHAPVPAARYSINTPASPQPAVPRSSNNVGDGHGNSSDHENADGDGGGATTGDDEELAARRRAGAQLRERKAPRRHKDGNTSGNLATVATSSSSFAVDPDFASASVSGSVAVWQCGSFFFFFFFFFFCFF
jgi:predicted permease